MLPIQMIPFARLFVLSPHGPARSEPEGSDSAGPPIRKIGWSATAQRCRIPRQQFTCHSKWFELHCHFHLIFRNPPTVPRADQPFGSARLGSEKRFLTIRRERVHLCKLSNLRFSLAYLVTSSQVAHRAQEVRKEQRRASAAPSGHRPLRTPPRECNKFPSGCKSGPQGRKIRLFSMSARNYYFALPD